MNFYDPSGYAAAGSKSGKKIKRVKLDNWKEVRRHIRNGGRIVGRQIRRWVPTVLRWVWRGGKLVRIATPVSAATIAVVLLIEISIENDEKEAVSPEAIDRCRSAVEAWEKAQRREVVKCPGSKENLRKLRHW